MNEIRTMTADDPFRLKITSTSASGKRESNRQGKATQKNTIFMRIQEHYSMNVKMGTMADDDSEDLHLDFLSLMRVLFQTSSSPDLFFHVTIAQFFKNALMIQPPSPPPLLQECV